MDKIKLPEGITKIPTEEEFVIPDDLKQILQRLFDWQEESAKTNYRFIGMTDK